MSPYLFVGRGYEFIVTIIYLCTMMILTITVK